MKIEVKFKVKSHPLALSDQTIDFVMKNSTKVYLKIERESCFLTLEGKDGLKEIFYAIWELLAWNDGYFYEPVEYIVDGCKEDEEEFITRSYCVTDEKWKISALLIGRANRDISEDTITRYMEIRNKGRKEQSMNKSMFSSYFCLISKAYANVNLEHRLVLLMHICDGFAIQFLKGTSQNNIGNINTVLNQLDIKKKYKEVKAILEDMQSSMSNDLRMHLKSNLESLEQILPKDLKATQINAEFGAAWIPMSYYYDFFTQILESPRETIVLHHNDKTGEWTFKINDVISNKARTNYATNRISVAKLIEHALQRKPIKIYDTYMKDDKEVREFNAKETAIAQAKQDQIKQAFEDWIFNDVERRERLVRLYNDKFNSIRPREYDGSHLNFVGMNPEIKLRKHQQNAIAHILYGRNTLLAHEVRSRKDL